MSLEESILELTKAMKANTKAVLENNPTKAVDEKEPAAQPDESVDTDEGPDTEEAPGSGEPATEEDARTALICLNREEGRAILKTLKAKKLGDVKKVDHQKCVALCIKAMSKKQYTTYQKSLKEKENK